MSRQAVRNSVAVLAAAATLASCSSTGRGSNAISSLGELPTEAPATTAPAATTTPPSSDREQQCNDNHMATASYPAAVSDDGFIRQLRSRGRIRVGLDENTQGLSARNPSNGELEGFEVDLAHEIAKRLFGNAYTPESVVAVPLVTSEKTDAVKEETVDITISAVSMSCKRWEDVDFSEEYYTAQQKFLVRNDSNIRRQGDLAGRRVCVTSSSSSIGILRKAVPKAIQVERPARTDCLLALQQGEADAYFGHDTFLQGMLSQDPTLEIRDLLDPDSTVSHYGIAVNRRHPELTRLINAYLDEIVAAPPGTPNWTDLVCASLSWKCLDRQRPVAPVPNNRREA